MKKVWSIMLALAIAASIATVPAFAAQVEEKYFDGTPNLETDVIDTEVNKPIALPMTEYDYTSAEPAVFSITEPCTVYAWLFCKNSEQTPTPQSLNYIMKLGAQNDEYLDFVYPGPNSEGDYEYLKYTVTKEALEAAGGAFSLYWGISTLKNPDKSISELGQTMTTGIAAYSAAPSSLKEESRDVKAAYQTGGGAQTVYSVELVWGSMEFTYTGASEGVWNPETHAFDGVTQAGWSCAEGADQITVTNHSNAAVNAALSYTPGAVYAGITGSLVETSGIANDGLLSLATAVGTPAGDAPTAAAALRLSGALDSGTANLTTIGTITVEITAVE